MQLSTVHQFNAAQSAHDRSEPAEASRAEELIADCQDDVRDSCIDSLADKYGVGDWVEDDGFAFELIANCITATSEGAMAACSKIREQFALNQGTKLDRMVGERLANLVAEAA